jgi:membrane fusion protein, multidrug efflux system
VLAVAFAVTACGKRAAEEVDTKAAVPVEVGTPRVGTITAYVRASGVVEGAPGADWTITAPPASRIAEIRGAAGDSLRKGTVAVRFDAPQLQAELAARSGERSAAEARQKAARASLERLSGLHEKGIAARKEVEDARKDVEEAEAAVRTATQGRAAAAAVAARAVAVAPFDAVVAQRWHNPGDLVDANEHVLRLVDPQRLEVACAVPVADAIHLARNRRAQVSAPGSAESEPLLARVVSAAALVDTATGTANVRLSLQGILPVGTPVQVQIAVDEHKDALILPETAVVKEAEHAAVFVVGPDQHAHKREVTLGLTSGPDVEIRSGLQSSDTVVIKGADGLPDGALVALPFSK